MKFLVQEPTVQHMGADPDKTQEEPGPESPHRAQHLQAPETQSTGRVAQKTQVK